MIEILIACGACGNVIYVEDDYKKRYRDGDVRKHCNMCGKERFEVLGL